MSFANFDNETSEILSSQGVKNNKNNINLIKILMLDFIKWCSNTYTKAGKTTYYITLNIGLANNEFARNIAHILLDCFWEAGELVFRPNIVFKVAKGISRIKGDPNYDIYIKAINIASYKMIPTFLLCDCESNKNTNPNLLAIVGCRTRVVSNVYGIEGAIGRGNIANISINLPRIALEIDKNDMGLKFEKKIRYI